MIKKKVENRRGSLLLLSASTDVSVCGSAGRWRVIKAEQLECGRSFHLRSPITEG